VLLTFGFGGQCFSMLARSGVKFHQRERLQSVQHSKIASILQPVCCVAGHAERSTMSFSARRVFGQRRNPEVHEDGNREIRREGERPSDDARQYARERRVLAFRDLR
jgi:hypothetical protein